VSLSADAKGRLSTMLASRQDAIVKEWTSIMARTMRGRQTEGELSRQVADIFGALETVLRTADDAGIEGSDAGEARATLSDLSRHWARQGFSPTETAMLVLSVKDALVGVLDAAGDNPMPADFVVLSRLVDDMGLFTFETYTKVREEILADQTEQLLELSTPVVKLWDGIVAVPLIGTLDSARAQVVMEKLLQTLVDTGAAHAIVDITGVPAVDTQVAQHILKTVVAARLMGAECVISGIRPQIAQTVVALGIEFGDIVTKASLADALMHTLRASGVEVSRTARKVS
jgi:rsbT co-antagonist protein RsbR